MAWSAGTPTTTTKVKDSPAIFQGNWAAVNTAIALEHQAMASGSPGAHLPGACGVMLVGTTAALSAVTPAACAAAYNTTLSAMQYGTGSAWTTIAENHNLMTGLASGDPHIQYVELSGASQVITEDITFQGSITMTADETVDGVDISAHAATAASLGHTGGLGVILGTPAAKSIDTVYQAATDGILVACANEPTNGFSCLMKVLSDAATPPTTLRAACKAEYGGGNYIIYASVTVPVIKSEYYKVTQEGYGLNLSGNEVFTIYFYPIGS